MKLEYNKTDIRNVLSKSRTQRIDINSLLENVVHLNAHWREKSFIIKANSYFGNEALTYKPILRTIYKYHPDLKKHSINRKQEAKITKEDFKGAYIYLYEDKPIYVGISRSCIYRTHQHLRTQSHFTSTLAYRIGKDIYNLKNIESPYKGSRKDFFQHIDTQTIFEFLQNCEIAYLPIENDDVLASFEIHFAVAHKIAMNTFRTH
ncbi:GIY-YIG nuclease family protein [Nonlabens ulvanivorans]|uniref:GIY-YIG catalytic domain-containing protein n=1 Tax=Nonlabens ulvanivorans TaxID=906888 RepID=A0A084JX69_NONUL|nr:hypothetical protein [Nonlabens ulvanivorans]KEZ93553.1 hypothetical protein IL45_04910 [Nonlabens ulvanivorans]PRX14130.1 hypothetical protein LY02_01159 [Nonlabens ulvanivorans]